MAASRSIAEVSSSDRDTWCSNEAIVRHIPIGTVNFCGITSALLSNDARSQTQNTEVLFQSQLQSQITLDRKMLYKSNLHK